MTKKNKLLICNYLLLIATPLMWASSIHMETTDSSLLAWTKVHAALGLTFASLVAWHLRLHFNSCNWIKFPTLKELRQGSRRSAPCTTG